MSGEPAFDIIVTNPDPCFWRDRAAGRIGRRRSAEGEPIRAGLVRNPASEKAAALATRGVEVVQGELGEPASIRRAMTGMHGVFSVQPSSPTGELSDEDEIRYGVAVADIAAEAGVGHLIYSSVGAVGDKPTGMAHFDSKARIEAHIRTLPLDMDDRAAGIVHGHADNARFRSA